MLNSSTPAPAARASRSAGASTPSDAVLWLWRSTRILVLADPSRAGRAA
jgi:hypothetical protein